MWPLKTFLLSAFAVALGCRLALAADEQCTTVNQRFCVNCNQAAQCLELTNGTLYPRITNCDLTGRTCMNGVCTVDDNHPCSEDVASYQFFCSSAGIYPDAYTCSKYHLCTPQLTNVVVECPTGFNYDPSTSLCSKRRNVAAPDDCRLPICKGVGQSGPVPGNPALYYVCLLIDLPNGTFYMPELFACPKNYAFTNGRCVDNTPSTGVAEDGRCIDDGNFYYPPNCRFYNECVINQMPVMRNCTAINGGRFDPVARNCTAFACQQ